MWFERMVIEKESPEQFGYDKIKYNLTESSMTDKTLKDAGISLPEDLVLCYGDHLGNEELREQLAALYGLGKENVIVTVGACMAVFLVYSTILKPEDHAVVMFPNYPADVDILHSLGCKASYYTLKEENGYVVNVDEIAAMIHPETKIVSITTPHNPTGAVIPDEDIRKLAAICAEKEVYLLVDETYGDLTLGVRGVRGASINPWVISIESLSKCVGVPGIRTGWIASGNEELIERMIATKEQICICGSVVDEECANQVLKHKDELLAPIREEIKAKFAILKNFLENQDVLNWVEPKGGVVCFPGIKPEIDLDTEEFYKVLNEKYGVYVGPGHWFSVDDRHFRIGFGWPTEEAVRKGLEGIVAAIRDVRRN